MYNIVKERSDIMSNVFYYDEDKMMLKAYEDARNTFKYFYRELTWDFKRVVSVLGNAIVKVTIQEDDIIEHMWINNIEFDGVIVSGILTNIPRELTKIKQGDHVEVKLSEIKDWMFVIENRAYGAFTVHVIRSNMRTLERIRHDNAWGLDFGDYNKPLVAYDQENDESVLIEHPIAISMKSQYDELIKTNINSINDKNTNGVTLLHNEATFGNKSMIEVLIKNGADLSIKNNQNKTAYDIAVDMGWNHLLDILEV